LTQRDQSDRKEKPSDKSSTRHMDNGYRVRCSAAEDPLALIGVTPLLYEVLTGWSCIDLTCSFCFTDPLQLQELSSFLAVYTSVSDA